jgi:hypothetical protein
MEEVFDVADALDVAHGPLQLFNEVRGVHSTS